MARTYWGRASAAARTFTGAVLEYAMSAGFTGQGAGTTLTEHTTAGERAIELPATSPYAAMNAAFAADGSYGFDGARATS
jgi:hypothetical protein